eukprot:scaffold13664_cov89-Isochrysis_galbana.AAC.6
MSATSPRASIPPPPPRYNPASATAHAPSVHPAPTSRDLKPPRLLCQSVTPAHHSHARPTHTTPFIPNSPSVTHPFPRTPAFASIPTPSPPHPCTPYVLLPHNPPFFCPPHATPTPHRSPTYLPLFPSIAPLFPPPPLPLPPVIPLPPPPRPPADPLRLGGSQRPRHRPPPVGARAHRT